MSNSPKQLSNARVSIVSLNSTGPIEALAVVQMDSTGGIVGGAAGGGSTQVSIKEILTSSGASVMDSTNNAINVNVVAGAAGGSTYVSVRQSTAADLLATVSQGSTVWQIQCSTVQGQVRIAPASTTFASSAGFHFDSSGALQIVDVSAVPPSTGPFVISSIVGQTIVKLNTSSGGGVEGSTTTPTGGSFIGLHVRQVFPTMASTTSLITSTNSTAVYALVSSASAVRHKVYAFIVTSSHTTPSTLVFMSSLGSDLYHAAFGSGSSGVTGVSSPGIQPPGFLFATAASEALNVRIEGGGSTAASTAIARVSISYFTEA